MERKIGEIFTYNGKMYQVAKSDICENCAFRENDCSILRSRIGLCISSIRTDKTNVIFKEINNMEIKSVKFLVVLVITFVIVFLMNYIGNTQPDKLQRALLNGLGGMVGLTIGMMIYNRSKNDQSGPQHFD